MKTAQELYSEWTDGEQNGMRPKRVQVLRDDLMQATGMSIPSRLSDLDGWLAAHKQSGTITRKLKQAAEGSDDESDDTENDDGA